MSFLQAKSEARPQQVPNTSKIPDPKLNAVTHAPGTEASAIPVWGWRKHTNSVTT